MHAKCAEDDVPTWLLEKAWVEQATGDPAVAPKWAYGAVLANITEPPTKALAPDDMLNTTALAPEAGWLAQYNTMTIFEHEETMHARYGYGTLCSQLQAIPHTDTPHQTSIILLATLFALPILLTLLPRLPYLTRLSDALTPYLIYPSLIKTYQVRPLPYLLGNAPTVGQTLYILLLVALTTIFSAISYHSAQPNAWYPTQHQEILAWVMYRTGVLAFALLPLVLLFAGRNNVLLWLSDWAHATYLLLHRWVARVFTVLVVLHSILALVLYKETGAYPAEERLPYWIWGAVGTVAVCVMVLGSGLVVRRWSYEVFLVGHVVLAVSVLVGCWYHVELRFQRKWGYEMWYVLFLLFFFPALHVPFKRVYN